MRTAVVYRRLARDVKDDFEKDNYNRLTRRNLKCASSLMAVSRSAGW